MVKFIKNFKKIKKHSFYKNIKCKKNKIDEK